MIDGAPHTPLLFVGNNQFGKDDVLLGEIRQAAQAGLDLFGFNIPLDCNGTAEQAAATIEKFCAANPDGYFFVRVWLGANQKWIKEHPDECITKYAESPEAAQRLNLASPSSEPWREATRRMLQDRIRQIAEGPHGAHFVGVTIEYLQTAEWFYPDTNDFMDYSTANLRAFREWLKKTYRKEKALRKAWNQPDVTFDTAQFPTPEMRDSAKMGPFRDVATQRSAMDMERFQNELVSDTIAYFAAAVKEVTARRTLVGAYYGYTMELNNNGPRALVQSGHLALGRLLECKDIDVFHAPFSYFERRIGEPGHLHAPVDSMALHGKLEICEQDFYTHLASAPSSGLIAPGWEQRTRSPEETVSILYRDFGNAFTHGAGMWFFDLLSDGRWQDPAVRQAASMMKRIAAEQRSAAAFGPEIAFAVSEDAPYYLRATTYPVLLHSLSWWRSELDRMGTQVGYYLQSDLPRLPDSVKMLILADAFAIDESERRAVERFLDRGGTVVWNYAPDLIGPDGVDLARIEDITGIAAEPKFDSAPMTLTSDMSKEPMRIDDQSWQPRFVVTGKDVDVVARYEATGEIAAAARPWRKGVSIYSAMPRLSVPVLCEIASRAGVHLYRDTSGMVGVVGRYLIAHVGESRPLQFAWPRPCTTVERVQPPYPIPLECNGKNIWTDKPFPNSTVVYRCE